MPETKKGKMNFYAVIYDPDGKNKTTWVEKKWIYALNGEIGYWARKYVFYHGNKEEPVPAENFMATLVKTDCKTKEDGFLYPATILKGFG